MNCFYCGVVTATTVRRSVNQRTRDHIVPRSRGGEVTVIACATCNGDKGNLTADEYRILIAWRDKKFDPDFAKKLLAEAERVNPFFGDKDLMTIKQQQAWEEAQGDPDWKRESAPLGGYIRREAE